MRLVITDTGLIWNKDNPFLEKYKDILLVVCLQGKKATDKYECFLSPYKIVGMGIDRYGVEDQKFQTLASVAGKLNVELGYHDDIVFLTDNEPSTLYPYHVIKELNQYNNLHLVAISPLHFEGKARIAGYHNLLADLSHLDSFLYYDINRRLTEIDKSTKLPEFLDLVTSDLGNLMPRFLNGIYHMENRPCFFDFASMEYVALKGGFENIDIANREKPVTDIDFPLMQAFSTLGLIMPPSYPMEEDYVKEEVERPVARLDGKKICNILREQRIKLAAANNIPFQSEECPSVGPCAGTCEKCDAEAAFLREAMRKIPEGKRVYPQFNPNDEVTI